MEISFGVRGLPAPQGSKKAFRVKGSNKINQVESSARLRPWRDRVHFAAEQAVERWDRDSGGRDALGVGDQFERFYHGPVAVAMDFRFERPASHFGTGRNAGRLKDSAPTYPTSRSYLAGGDIDKLVRAVLDAMSRTVYHDDAQVVGLASVWKSYGDQGGVYVTVREAPAFVLRHAPLTLDGDA